MQLLPLSVMLIALGMQEANQPEIRTAIERGLRRIEEGAASYPSHRQCFSCHHQALPILALTSARRRGFAVDPAKIRQQVDFTLNTFVEKRDLIAKGKWMPGGNTTAVYALMTLEASGRPPDETTAAIASYLVAHQSAAGSWPPVAQRPPSEGSIFTNNALALRALRAYGTGETAKPDPDFRARVEKAVSRGIDWLEQNTPATTEDKVSRLRGLVWGRADSKKIAGARELLAKSQNADGSWSQLETLSGDVYATGTALVALHIAGISPSSSVYQRGMTYLHKTQRSDGAWLIATRSHPVQTFFDNGDPGGKSQFISFSATNWAVLALLQSFPIQLPPLL